MRGAAWQEDGPDLGFDAKVQLRHRLQGEALGRRIKSTTDRVNERANRVLELLDASGLGALNTFDVWNRKHRGGHDPDTSTLSGVVSGIQKERTVEYMCMGRLATARILATEQGAPSAAPFATDHAGLGVCLDFHSGIMSSAERSKR